MSGVMEPGQLELKLLTMPIDRMLAAIEAIDDLDQLLLEMLTRDPKPEISVEEWQSKFLLRRKARARFIEFRVSLERGERFDA